MNSLLTPRLGNVYRFLIAAAIGLLLSSTSRAELYASMEIDVAQRGPRIPENFFGLMTEEINHSYDGGLYAELIQNRTFQDPAPQGGGRGGRRRVPIHWSEIGSGRVSVDRTNPVNDALPLSLKLDLRGGDAGVANDGYWGIPVRPNTTYTATFFAKGSEGFSGPVTASLHLDEGNKTVAEAATANVTGAWQKYTVKLQTKTDAPTTAKARFVLSASGTGSVSFSYVSLFPPTYKNAPNGLRPDIMELLAAMKPRFIRFPGGNYVEGSRFADRFKWKQMIGPPEERPGHMGCWSYRSSDGMGMPEFLLWCKQLDAEPVLGLFAGYVLNRDHFRAGTPEMELYTQEALQEIEYVMGPADSQWGSRRAADGFPEPFPLRYVEIGNEDWFDGSGSYDGRFTQIAEAIRAKYPELKIIATAPVESFKPDLYDDHYYRSPRQLREMFTMYDKRPSDAPPLQFSGGGWSGRLADDTLTFVGEWAAHEGAPTTNLNAGLADAAFLMGCERNSDAVLMECYAPLFANVNLADEEKGYPRGWQWEHNLIGYDALGSFGSPSYHAQVMLAENKGDVVLATNFEVPETPPKQEDAHGMVGVGSWHTDVQYTDLSVTAPDGSILLSSEDTGDRRAWENTERRWRVRDNSIQTTNGDSETWAFIGDPNWTDYTIRLRARKSGGQEGFIVIFHAADEDHYQWWNIGGWGNTVARTEASEGGARGPYGPGEDFAVETNRWYDLRLEVTGNRVRGYVDDELITDTTYDPGPTSTPFFASATQREEDGTVFVKVVNAGDAPINAAIKLSGVGRVEPEGTAVVLTGEPKAMNSVAEPRKIAPQEEALSGLSESFQRTFPPHSFTILRLDTAAP